MNQSNSKANLRIIWRTHIIFSGPILLFSSLFLLFFETEVGKYAFQIIHSGSAFGKFWRKSKDFYRGCVPNKNYDSEIKCISSKIRLKSRQYLSLICYYPPNLWENEANALIILQLYLEFIVNFWHETHVLSKKTPWDFNC